MTLTSRARLTLIWWLFLGLSIVSSISDSDVKLNSSSNWFRSASIPPLPFGLVGDCFFPNGSDYFLSIVVDYIFSIVSTWPASLCFNLFYSLFSMSLLMYDSSIDDDWLRALLVVSSTHFNADLLTEWTISSNIAQKSSMKKVIASESGFTGSSNGFNWVSSNTLKLCPWPSVIKIAALFMYLLQ